MILNLSCWYCGCGHCDSKMLTATKQDKKKLPQTIVQTTEEQTSTAQGDNRARDFYRGRDKYRKGNFF